VNVGDVFGRMEDIWFGKMGWEEIVRSRVVVEGLTVWCD
jgi:hypothetical protein